MSNIPVYPENKKKSKEDSLKEKLRLAKSSISLGQSIVRGDHEKVLQKSLLTGIKMAATHPFQDPLCNPLVLASSLKQLGLEALTWTPETLCSEIDRRYNGWDDKKVGEALAHFHKYGVIKTDIPQLVREKLYAIRVIATSDTAHTEWHIFEKVGGAFNDRPAKFGVVEPLSAAECARTIAIMENIRPDTYSDAVKIYIAACCHEAGLLTVTPIKWLSMCEQYLQRMNQDATGDTLSLTTKTTILQTFQKLTQQTQEVDETVESIQAAKLAAIDAYASEILPA